MPLDPTTLPSVRCRSYIITEFDRLPDRLRAYGNDVRAAVEDLSPEPLPSDDRWAQQQFIECLDAMSWHGRDDAHAAARALFDRLFWSWRSEEMRIVDLENVPYALDSAWGPQTVGLFAQLWAALEPELPEVRPAFDRAASAGEIVGKFEAFIAYARAWGNAIRRAAEVDAGLIVVQFEPA